MKLRLLVALDGAGASANATIDTAMALTKAHRASTEVVSVVNPFAAAWGPMGLAAVAVAASGLEGEQRLRRLDVRRYIADRTASRRPWPVRVPLGNPGSVILDAVGTSEPDLLVMGLRRTRLVDRIVRDATTQHVVQDSPVPVLAVTPDLGGMPRTVVVAMDFSRESTAAAQLACTLFTRCARLVFVHVESEFDTAIAKLDDVTRMAHENGWAAAFERVIGALSVPPSATVETAVVSGTVPAALIAFAKRRGADVLVAARKHHDITERVIAGSAALGLVRRAPCSLLITPPGAADKRGRGTTSRS